MCGHVVWFGLLRSLAEKHRSREAQLSTAATASIRDALRTSFGDCTAFALPYALGTGRTVDSLAAFSCSRTAMARRMVWGLRPRSPEAHSVFGTGALLLRQPSVEICDFGFTIYVRQGGSESRAA